MRVLYTGFSIHEPFKVGESDCVLVDKDYVRVDGQLLHAGFVWPDTTENREHLTAYQKAYDAWKKSEPNVYDVLHKMERLPLKKK